jgi:hypothetical protein
MKKSKRIFPFLVLITLSALLSVISYYTLRSAFTSEDELSKYTGEVVYKDVITETSLPIRDPDTGTRQSTTQDFFHLKLKGLDRTLSYYALDERYGKLERSFNLGDVVTVIYDTPDHTSLELLLYKIEKDGIILLDSSGQRLRGKIGGVIAAIGALLVLLKAVSILRSKAEQEEPPLRKRINKR